jgi:DNA-binding CsgD family transcriptional regulator
MSVLERSLASCASPFGHDVLLLSKIEADWLAGRFDAVLDEAPALQEGLEVLAALARARTAFEAERAHLELRDIRVGAFAAAVDAELVGLSASGRGDVRACELLVDAAGLWAGHVVRCELACLWEAGEAARRVGRRDRARQVLLDAGRRCESLGFVPLHRRIQRSLRLLGEDTPGARGRQGALTAREREVMTLVAEGLSTRAIAARLLISPATVDTHVRAVRDKLGARTRAEAVLATGLVDAAADRR